MHTVLVVGAGKIGSLITFLLAQSNRYTVYLADIHAENVYAHKLGELSNCHYIQLDAKDIKKVEEVIKQYKIEAVISSLPFYCNVPIAKAAAATKIHYFDLTEDTKTTEAVELLAQNNTEIAFVPQCGLAPGFISIITNHLMQHFTSLQKVKMRVGALPINVSNALQYSLTWSTDGLINEYGNLCKAIVNGKLVDLQPLEGFEKIEIDGLTYEAFNTSGGVGSLVESYQDKVESLSYKTIRYPGHCEKMQFLMNDLNLNEDRDTLKRILENSLPKTYQDVVIVYVSVTGTQSGQYIEENYVQKFYPKTLGGQRWSAIQLTTASGICVAVDLVLENPKEYRGFVRQEQFSYDALLNNHFGKYYANHVSKE